MDVYGSRDERERGAERHSDPDAGAARCADRAGRLRARDGRARRRHRAPRADLRVRRRRACGDGVPSRLRHPRGSPRRARGPRWAPAHLGAQPPRAGLEARVTARSCDPLLPPRRRARASCVAVRRRDTGGMADLGASSWPVPGIAIAGGHSPPHRPLTETSAWAPPSDQHRCARRRVGGIGATKQGLWMAQMRPILEARCWRRGAAFDFIATASAGAA